jgi:histidinol-phosphate phosphatase family protein
MVASNFMILEAVFLDRDGVLNPHIPGGYLQSAMEAALMPGVAIAISRLNDAGLPVIIISNQQGVGKGLMSWDDLMDIEQSLEESLKREAGAFLTRCYYCYRTQSRKLPAPKACARHAAGSSRGFRADTGTHSLCRGFAYRYSSWPCRRGGEDHPAPLRGDGELHRG